MNLVRTLLRSCRTTMRRQRIVDSSGMRLTGAGLLVRSLILRRLLLREVLTDDERIVGILLPPSAAGALANFALTLAGRVVVNLNYTLRESQLDSCIKQAGIVNGALKSQRLGGSKSQRPKWSVYVNPPQAGCLCGFCGLRDPSQVSRGRCSSLRF